MDENLKAKQRSKNAWFLFLFLGGTFLLLLIMAGISMVISPPSSTNETTSVQAETVKEEPEPVKTVDAEEAQKQADKAKEDAEKRRVADVAGDTLEKLQKAGIVYKISISERTIYVNSFHWMALKVDQKEQLTKMAVLYCQVYCFDGDTLGTIIKDANSGKELATYDKLWGFKIKD